VVVALAEVFMSGVALVELFESTVEVESSAVFVSGDFLTLFNEIPVSVLFAKSVQVTIASDNRLDLSMSILSVGVFGIGITSEDFNCVSSTI